MSRLITASLCHLLIFLQAIFLNFQTPVTAASPPYFSDFNTTLSPKPIAITELFLKTLYNARKPAIKYYKTISYEFAPSIDICSKSNISCTNFASLANSTNYFAEFGIYCAYCVSKTRPLEEFLEFHTKLRNGSFGNFVIPSINVCGGPNYGLQAILPPTDKHVWCLCFDKNVGAPKPTCDPNYRQFEFFMDVIFPPIALVTTFITLFIFILLVYFPDVVDMLQVFKRVWKNGSKWDAIQVLFRMRSVTIFVLLIGICCEIATLSLLIFFGDSPVFEEAYKVLPLITASLSFFSYGMMLIFWMSVIDSTNEGKGARLTVKHKFVFF